MEHSFAALGWLNRCAHSVGSDRFDESVRRTRFCLEKAAHHAATPAEAAVIDGLAASLGKVIEADAEARRLLADSVSGIADACGAEASALLTAIEGG